jgi:hypothetical protein
MSIERIDWLALVLSIHLKKHQLAVEVRLRTYHLPSVVTSIEDRARANRQHSGALWTAHVHPMVDEILATSSRSVRIVRRCPIVGSWRKRS